MAGTKIFICYRRQNGAEAARVLREALRQRHFPVFMDVEDLRAGQFGQILTSQVQECSDFILVLTPGCLDRCAGEGDWVSREIAEALALGKNIVPVCFDEMSWPEQLPAEIAALREFQVCRYSREYHEPSIQRLIQCLRTKPHRPWTIDWSQRLTVRLAVAAAVALILAGSFFLLPKIADAWRARASDWSQPVGLQWSPGTNEPVSWGDAKLILSVIPNGDSFRRRPDAMGRVDFSDLPATARNRRASVKLEADQWELTSPGDIPRLGEKPVVLKVQHTGFRVQGWVKSVADGHPLEGVWVSLPGSSAKTNTDTEGHFSLSCPGSAWQPRVPLLATNTGWFSTNVTVSAYSDPALAEIFLREKETFTFEVVLSGPENAQEWDDLRSGLLVLRLPGGDPELKEVIEPSGEELGHVRFESIRPTLLESPAELALQAPGWRFKTSGRVTLSSQPIHLQVEREGRTVSGRVVDQEHDEPLAGVLVSIGGLSTNTDDQGVFTFFLAHVPLGARFNVTATKAGWDTGVLTNTSIAGRLKIVLHPPEPFAQVVRLDAGSEAWVDPGTPVELLLDGAPPIRAPVDKNGDVRFERVPRAFLGQTGTVQFAEATWRVAPGRERIVLAAKHPVIPAQPIGFVVAGLVSGADGTSAIAAASVSINAISTTTDTNGAFRVVIPGFPPPAEMRVAATCPGWQSTNLISASGTGPLVVRLARLPPVLVVTDPPPAPTNPPPTRPKLPSQLPPLSRPKTEAELQTAIARDPQNPAAYCEFGDFLLKLDERPRLEDAVKQFRQAERLSQGPNQQAQRAAALNSLGLAYNRLEKPVEALKSFDLALEQYRKLVRSDSSQHRRDLAICLWNRGKAREALRDFAGALNSYSDAFDNLNQLQPLNADDTNLSAELGGIRAAIGWVQFKLRHAREGASEFSQAVEIFRRARADQAGSPHRSSFAFVLNQFAVCLSDEGDLSQAIALCKEAIDCYTDAGAGGTNPVILEDLALPLRNLAVCYAKAANLAQARDTYLIVLTNYQTLAKDRREKFLPKVAEAETELADVLADIPDLRTALKIQGDAVALYKTLAGENVALYNEPYARALNRHAGFLSDQGQRDAARDEFEQSVSLYQRLAETKAWTNHANCGQALSAYANFLNEEIRRRAEQHLPPRAGDVATAKKDYAQALQSYERCGDGVEDDKAATLDNWGTLLYNVDDLETAYLQYNAAVAQALRFWEKQAPNPPFAVKICSYYQHLLQASLDLLAAPNLRGSNRKRATEALAAASQAVKKPLSGLAPATLAPLEQQMAVLKNKLDGKSR